MKSKKLKIIALFSFIIAFFSAVLTLGSGSVSNQFRNSYKIFVELEESGRLKNPPQRTSLMALGDIGFVDGYYPGLDISESFVRYIRETNDFGKKVFIIFFVSSCSFLLSFSLLMIRFKKSTVFKL